MRQTIYDSIHYLQIRVKYLFDLRSNDRNKTTNKISPLFRMALILLFFLMLFISRLTISTNHNSYVYASINTNQDNVINDESLTSEQKMQLDEMRKNYASYDILLKKAAYYQYQSIAALTYDLDEQSKLKLYSIQSAKNIEKISLLPLEIKDKVQKLFDNYANLDSETKLSIIKFDITHNIIALNDSGKQFLNINYQ